MRVLDYFIRQCDTTERYYLLNVFIELACVTILGIDKENEVPKVSADGQRSHNWKGVELDFSRR